MPRCTSDSPLAGELHAENALAHASTLGLAIPKKSSRAAEQDRPDVARLRADWSKCQTSIDPSRLVFIDETGLQTEMTRRRGWAPAGERLVESVPGGHWRTSTLVQAISLEETRTAMILDGPLNSISFTGFCRQFLAPVLHRGELVVLDNLSNHKSQAAVEAIESAGAMVIYLPAHSPDLNPIENIFSKVKQLIRGLRPQRWGEVVDSVKQALLRVTHADLQNAFEHCDYTTTQQGKLP